MLVASRYQAIEADASRRRADALIEWLRSWAERRLDSRLIDERRSIPPHVVLDFGNQGLFGIQVEERAAGLALRNRDVARVLEQAAAIDLGLGTFLLTSLFPGVRPIAAHGGERSRRELLPDLARGRMLAGFAQTEPGAGTHFPAMATEARATAAGGWRLSGDKVWIGNASWAGVLTVMAHDVDPRGRRRGLTAFAVRADAPGVTLGRELLSMGMRGMVQAEVAFRDVELGPDDVVGEREQGLEVAVDSMSFARFAIAATCVGSLRRCARLMLRFAGRRSIGTGRLLDHPVTRIALGETVARTRAAEALLYRVADLLDGGRPLAAELFAACKLAASEFLGESADRLVQLLGSRGYDEANQVPQLLRDARVTRIFEGASEALAAFLGAAALNPRSELHEFLRNEPGGLAEALAEVVRSLRERAAGSGEQALPRTLQSALAGWAALWALLAATTARSAGPEIASWARECFDEAAERAARGAPVGAGIATPAELEKAVAELSEPIGDVEERAPGERRGLDPLLRRAAPGGGA